jgi:drug/metabolite transporter (DMT)-like permease
MPRNQLVVLTLLALMAFAGNSLLCRIALVGGGIDPASFTTVRLVSGAIVLALIARWRSSGTVGSGNALSALALFAYAAAFSFAYVGIAAGTGALLLFGSVQATMIGVGLWRGERFTARQWAGFVLALAGLLALMLPGIAAPPLANALLMILAGAAWGVYSIRGKGQGDPLRVTAGNFIRAVVPAVALSAAMLPWAVIDARGAMLAVASGALASGVGYAIWYAVLPRMKVTAAATVQLGVPVVAALGGIVWLDETLSVHLVLASAAVLGGIALVVLRPRPAP